MAKFPPDRKRSAVIQSLFAAQEQNQGFLTDELIAAVAKYLDLPTVWAYEVASFYSMLETKPVGRNNVAICTNISLLAQRRRRPGARIARRSWASSSARARPTAASTSSAKKSASPPASTRRR